MAEMARHEMASVYWPHRHAHHAAPLTIYAPVLAVLSNVFMAKSDRLEPHRKAKQTNRTAKSYDICEMLPVYGNAEWGKPPATQQQKNADY